jgi:hypothetical protein
MLTTLVAAILSTVGLAVLWYADASAMPGPPPRPGGPPPPPPSRFTHATLTVAVGIFVIAWVAATAAAVRDQIVSRIDQIGDRVARSAIEFAEQREEEGVFRGMKIAATDEHPDPDPGPGGHVLPFQR